MKKDLQKKQYEKNTLIIDNFKEFKDFIKNDKLEKSETILTLACGLAVIMCKAKNKNSLLLKSKLTGAKENDFLSADVEINVKNIKYKQKNDIQKR